MGQLYKRSTNERLKLSILIFLLLHSELILNTNKKKKIKENQINKGDEITFSRRRRYEVV